MAAASTRSRPQIAARYGRAAAAPTRRPRPRASVRRRRPQPSGFGKLLQGVARRPGASRGKGRSAGAKGPAGAALLFSAVGLAFKNRDKLTSMLRRKDEDADVTPIAESADIPPSQSEPTYQAPHNSAGVGPA